METNHPYFTINLKDHTKNTIYIPSRRFPKNFSINNDEFFCGGYFAGYNCFYTTKELTELFRQKKFSTLANQSADFLIVFIDKLSCEIFVLTGQSGRFPCFFYFEDNILHISTDFGFLTKQINTLSVDLDFLLDDLYDNHLSFLTESTLFKEIKQIPPATLLTIKRNGDFTLSPLINLKHFLPKKEKLSLVEFADETLKLLNTLIDERLTAIDDLPFIAELSSGYDSSLVAAILAKKAKVSALSYLSSLAPDINDENITKRFGSKHGIDVTFVNIDNLFTFSTEDGQAFIQNHYYPMDHGVDQKLKSNSRISKMGYDIVFEGFGGDEFHKGGGNNKWIQFPLQIAYFLRVSNIKNGYNKLFTDKGLHFIFGRDHFSKRSLFPNAMEISSLNIGLHYFPVYWETKTWGISPFSDLRMTELSTYCQPNAEKQDIWKQREDIFLKEQLVEKRSDFSNHANQYLTNTKSKEKMIDILQNSYLTDIGIIKGGEIIDNLKSGKESLYTEELSLVLLNILMVEKFLQGVLNK